MISEQEIISLAFNWENYVLAVGGLEGRIQLWDTQSGQPLGLDIVWDQETWLDPVGAVTALAFSRDGSTLASGNHLGQIALWDLETRRQIGLTVQAAGAPISGLLFAPDGLSLVSAAQDGSLQRWDLDPESWIKSLCSLTGRDFTTEELQELFPGQDVAPVCAAFLQQPAPTPID